MNNKIKKFKSEKILTKKDEQDKEENTKVMILYKKIMSF